MQIINPWIFYLISVLANLSMFVIVAFVISVGASIILMIIISESYGEEKEHYKKVLKRISLPILVVSVALIVFIPSEKTMYAMWVSSYVTTDNIDKATEVIQDGVDYIFDKLDSDEDE